MSSLEAKHYHIGKEGFIWWMGVVEDRLDPEQLGRVRVRCFGWHTEDKSLIPTESLPWASPVHSPNQPAAYTPKEGDWVFGFFADGNSAQHPFVLGVLTGFPVTQPDKKLGFSDPAGVYPKRLNESTLNRLSRGREDGTIIETRKRNLKKGIICTNNITWDEPSPTFSPTYPSNYAHVSESGHAFELDDTIGKERVHLAHKNGSFIELDTSGNRIDKITKDRFVVIVGNDYVSIDGVCNITVKGNCNLKTTGDLNVEAKNINIAASTNIKIKAASRLMLEGNTIDIKSSGVSKIGAGAKLNLKGKSVGVQGKSVSLAGKVSNKVKYKKSIGKILPTGSASSPSDTGLKTP